ncbi:protein kinase domain-containing protein [Theileria equi strain WA]|uniref:Cyclin-dependent kinase 2 homolog n=1 Tax=Theileria equi strain WA TaxID=1537102 RepID=L0B1I0_THEEQ|nr:protein kinase domain-containing protein [Theileria equi strain WA]AFZ81353.1 protein kinase domain-containing protein [Theileria equi strain WA]|eukprot:XP_004831019.1 protein kinase domain-containing protein [Theileria equi strain WA]
MSDYLLTPEHANDIGVEPDTTKFDVSAESKPNIDVLKSISEGENLNTSTISTDIDDVDSRKHNYICTVKCCRDVENFKCLNKISEGTYGTVYRALDRETGEIVALKHIKYHDVQWKEGFPITYLREISILLELKHPNILSVREVVTNKKRDQYYMVMEYVEHELKTLLHDGKINFTLSERKCLLEQLLKGTNYMHQNWVMHRDLKTTNILYNNRGVLKICDFGMARKFGNPIKTYTQNVVTHWYRAPELFLGQKEYTEKTDMWSVGCIFAEIILSKPLFMGANDSDTLDKIFKLCGSPTEENWPGFSQLPAIKNNIFQINSYKPTFHKVFNVGIMGGMLHGSTCMTELGLDLLKKMLKIDPNQRISAKDALMHPYLTQEKPTTKTVELMPTLRDTNCIDRNKQESVEHEER